VIGLFKTYYWRASPKLTVQLEGFPRLISVFSSFTRDERVLTVKKQLKRAPKRQLAKKIKESIKEVAHKIQQAKNRFQF